MTYLLGSFNALLAGALVGGFVWFLFGIGAGLVAGGITAFLVFAPFFTTK